MKATADHKRIVHNEKIIQTNSLKRKEKTDSAIGEGRWGGIESKFVFW